MRKFASIALLLSVLIMNDVRFLPNAFFCIYWYAYMWFFFFFNLVMWWIALTDFQILNQSCIPEGRPCLEEQNALACFRMVSFLPPPARSTRGFYLDIHCENQVELLKAKLRKVSFPYDGVPLEFFNSEFSTETLEILSYSDFSHPGTGFLWVFCLRISAVVKLWFSVVACLFNFGSSGSSCDLIFLMDLWKIIYFHIFDFYLLLAWTSNTSKNF